MYNEHFPRDEFADGLSVLLFSMLLVYVMHEYLYF